MNSLSLNQGDLFIKKRSSTMQNKENRSDKKTYISSSSILDGVSSLLPYNFQEGVETMNNSLLDGSLDAKKSEKTLLATNIKGDQQSEIERLNIQYKNAVKATNDAQEKYNDAYTDVINRRNPAQNKYLTKNIKLNDGTLGYLSNLGNFQQYDDINATAGKNGCPSASDLQDMSFGLSDIINHPSIMIAGENKKAGTACGNEGNNIYVSHTIENMDPSYVGCFKINAGAMKVVNAVIDNYEDGKRYAMNNGYKYFGFFDGNKTTQTMKCMVGNDLNRIKAKGSGLVYNIKSLWSSNTSTGKSGSLAKSGQIIVSDQPNNKGKIKGKYPNNSVPGCEQGGTLNIESASYGRNCNNQKNRTSYRVCTRRFWGICWSSQTRYRTSNRYPNVPENNVKSKVIDLVSKKGESGSWWGGNLVPIGDKMKNGLTYFWIQASNSIFGDPARGCRKDLHITYRCGDGIPKSATASERNWIVANCANEAWRVCNFYLILQDDGNMCIYKGTGPNDNQGGIWCTYTNGQQYKRGNIKSQAKFGKYGRNYIRSTEFLNENEWVGSNDGSLKLVMQGDGNLVLYTIESYNSCTKFNNGKYVSTDRNGIAVYELPKIGIPENVGKLGYIDGNGNINEYNKMEGGKGYNSIPNTNSPGNDLNNMPITNSSYDMCPQACNDDPKCFGYVFEKNTNNCYLKNKNIVKDLQLQSKSTDMYIRNVKPSNINESCVLPTKNVDSIVWSHYQKSNKRVTSDSLCGIKDINDDPTLMALKQDLDRKKEISTNIGLRLSETNQNLNSKRDTQNIQTNTNTTIDVNNNQVYGKTMDKKIPKAVEISVNPKEKVETGKDGGFTTYQSVLDIETDPSQRATTVNFKNINSIVEDSTLVMQSNSSKYIIWSILAIMTSMIFIKVSKKM